MAITREIWVDYIIENLFKGNEFLSKSFDEGDFVLGGSVVHIPQAGAKPNVEKNRAVFPATVQQRTDTDITYSLAWFTTDPFVIRDAEQAELSYDKIASILREQMAALQESVADELLYQWAAAGAENILRTSGASTTALAPGATGNRKKFLKEDLKKARLAMNKLNVPKEGRVALIPSDLMDQLLDDADLKVRDNSLELDMKGGVVTRLYGFDLMERSAATIYDNTGTPVKKLPDAASAISDNLAIQVWHPGHVSKALGSVGFFEDLKNPQHYGDIYSADVRCGGRVRRADSAGVISIVQEAI